MSKKQPRPKKPRKSAATSPVRRAPATSKRSVAPKSGQPQQPRSPALVWFMRSLPLLALLGMLLIIIPPRQIWQFLTTPRNNQDNETSTGAEPVFIVEGAQVVPSQDDLPLPNWSLEIASIFTPEVQYWAEDIGRWSVEYRIKPNLIAAIIQTESCGNPAAISDSGEVGLFQVRPDLFAEEDLHFDPNTNARVALTLFSELYAEANGDLGVTFAAYTTDASIIGVSPIQWPAEAQVYQFWASGIYEEAEAGFTQSPTLIEWLENGGDTICTQAANALGIPRSESGSD